MQQPQVPSNMRDIDWIECNGWSGPFNQFKNCFLTENQLKQLDYQSVSILMEPVIWSYEWFSMKHHVYILVSPLENPKLRFCLHAPAGPRCKTSRFDNSTRCMTKTKGICTARFIRFTIDAACNYDGPWRALALSLSRWWWEKEGSPAALSLQLADGDAAALAHGRERTRRCCAQRYCCWAPIANSGRRCSAVQAPDRVARGPWPAACCSRRRGLICILVHQWCTCLFPSTCTPPPAFQGILTSSSSPTTLHYLVGLAKVSNAKWKCLIWELGICIADLMYAHVRREGIISKGLFHRALFLSRSCTVT
jgi:hypothetical protein